MEDGRSLRRTGEILVLGDTEYRITGISGCGGSSVVYQAAYRDMLNPDQEHQVLIKELYPWHSGGGIYRDVDGRICWTADMDEWMEDCRQRFRQGNQINLELLRRFPSSTSGNLNSYDAYGTYYSVLAVHGGSILQDMLEDGAGMHDGRVGSDSQETSGLLRWAAEMTGRIADALSCFHQDGLLHLDISPDNILVLPEQVLLIDYNSAWDINKDTASGFAFSEKAGYSAPEVRLRDISQIGFASDLYSVCAVFFRLLADRPLTEEDILGNRLKDTIRRLEAFSGEPLSAAQKASQILIKGLHMLPRMRFQGTDELRAELDELINRIDGRGISYSAVWETSRAMRKKQRQTEDRYLPQKVSAGSSDPITPTQLYQQLADGRNILLTGPGGMGKSRLLRELWLTGTGKYRPTAPVVFYIPLKGYQQTPGAGDYIRNYFIRHLSFSGQYGDMAGAMHELEHLFRQGTDPASRFILLLDGLNETGDRRERLLKEIEMIAGWEGISVLVTERSDEVMGYALNEFSLAKLFPLDETVVEMALREDGLSVPEDKSLRELLSNPMMLELYRKAASMQREDSGREVLDESGIRCADDMIHTYLNHLLNRQLRIDSGDAALQLCHKYILEHLFPDIADEMKKQQSTLLTLDELYEVVRRGYRELHESEFGRVFPEYLGKSRVMLAGIRSDAEWFDFAVTEQLTGNLNLLAVTEDNCYGMPHDNFIDALSKKAEENRSLYRKKQRKRRYRKLALPAGAALILLTGGLLIQRTVVPHLTVETHAITEEQQRTIDRAVVCLQTNLNALSRQVSAQRAILEEAGTNDVLQNDESAIRQFGQLIDLKIGELEVITVISLKEDIVSELLTIRPDIPMDVMQSLCQSPTEMKTVLTQAIAHLETVFCDPDSVYDDEEKKAPVLDAYNGYLDAYSEYIFYELDYLLLFLSPDDVNAILDSNLYSEMFRDYYRTVKLSGQDPDEVRHAMELAREKVKDAQEEMINTGFPNRWSITP